MKVIFITREGYRLSGARVRCYHFSKELEKYGVATEVLSFADHLGARDGEKELEMSMAAKMRLNVKAFKHLLKKEKDAIFFVQRLNYHSLAPFFVSLVHGQKIVFDCDDWNIREDPRYYLGFIPSSKMEFLTKKFARHARLCITASMYLKHFLSPYARHLEYIPTGVDCSLFKPLSTKDVGDKNIVLGWAGTAYHEEMYTNLIFILDIFSMLAQQDERFVLRLAGEGQYFKKLASEIETHRFKDRIHVDHWINPDAMPAYVNNIDIGLLPLIQNTKFNQAKSPTKLFEYMACAKPAVCSYVGEAGSIISDGVNGYLADSREDFFKKIKLLADRPDLRKTIGEAARQDVENKYSLSVLGARLFEVLSHV